MALKGFDYGDSQVLVCGHRGEACFGLENTMYSFERAINVGVDMIETDVHISKDGHLILMHDDSVDRTTDGTGKIRDLTLSQIKALDATVNSAISVKKQPPPTLNELLELAVKHPRLILNVELKDYPDEVGELAYESADKVCRMLIDYGVAGRSFINSFSGRLLEYVYENYGDSFFYHGFYPWFILGEMKLDPESFIDVACMQHRVMLDDGTIKKCEDNMCPREWFDHLLQKGIMPLMAPSLKEYPLYDLAFSYGSRMVNPDNPEKMLEHLREKGLHL